MSTARPASTSSAIARVSTLELFFDLVFVFAVTQLTGRIAHPHHLSDYLQAMLVFFTLMWMYGGYTWLTSNLALERPLQRFLLFAAMVGFFVMALSIPAVFEAGGLPYALGLLSVTAIHAALFATVPTVRRRAVGRITMYNGTMALVVLAAAFVQPPWDWPWWLAAVTVPFVLIARRAEREFQLSPAHFVERNGLLVIVALGESVVAVGLGAAELPITSTLVLTAVLALFLSAALWWTYFDQDPQRAEHRFAAATPAQRARMGLLGFGVAHFILIFGIILVAAGLEVGIAHPLGPAEAAGSWNLASGLAVYLIGDTLYRWVLHIGPGRLRLLVAALAFATVPLGLRFGAVMQVAACVLVLLAVWLVDQRVHASQRS